MAAKSLPVRRDILANGHLLHNARIMREISSRIIG
jgi:hypothetical protein